LVKRNMNLINLSPPKPKVQHLIKILFSKRPFYLSLTAKLRGASNCYISAGH